jgi:hypothetical protein
MWEIWLSAAVYAGLILILAGAVNLVVPIRRLRIPTRRRALAIAFAGLTLAVAALTMPAGTPATATGTTQFDQLHARWQFQEVHDTVVAAPPALVYRAVKEVTAPEIALFRTLTAIRRLGRPGPESLLNPPADKPIFDVATRTGFLLLADQPDREMVLGAMLVAADPSLRQVTPGEYAHLDNLEGVAKVTMNFRMTAEGPGTRLSTETRVFASDHAFRQRFARYWRVIYPGSSLIRYAWLRAIRLRAEAAAERQRLESAPRS